MTRSTEARREVEGRQDLRGKGGPATWPVFCRCAKCPSPLWDGQQAAGVRAAHRALMVEAIWGPCRHGAFRSYGHPSLALQPGSRWAACVPLPLDSRVFLHRAGGGRHRTVQAGQPGPSSVKHVAVPAFSPFPCLAPRHRMRSRPPVQVPGWRETQVAPEQTDLPAILSLTDPAKQTMHVHRPCPGNATVGGLCAERGLSSSRRPAQCPHWSLKLSSQRDSITGPLHRWRSRG